MVTALAIAGVTLLLLSIAVGVYGSFEITRIPFLAIPYTPEDFGCRYEKFEFRSRDGLVLRGWFLPADQASATTIFVLHGLGSNSGDMLAGSHFLRDGGKWNLCFFDFRGHGNSDGTRTTLGMLELEDFEAAMDYVKRAKPQATQRLGVYGHSMGAAVAIVAAARHPELLGIIAESPFSSISQTVRRFAWVFYGIPYMPFIPLALLFTSLRLGRWFGTFAPVRLVHKLSPRPFFLIQAERDLRMPLNDSKAIFAAAHEPKEWWLVPGADHGEPWLLAPQEFEQRLIGFFRRVFP